MQKEFDGAHVLADVAGNAVEASRTAIIDCRSASKLGIGCSLTYGSGSATAITLVLHKSFDNGTTYQRVPSIAVLSGTGTASPYTHSDAVTGDDSTCLSVDVDDCTHVKVIAGVTNGGAADLLNLYVCRGIRD